jgi:hypothetical protein
MIVVGVLLVVLAALFLAGFVLSAGGSTEAEFYGLILPNLSARALVLIGLALGLVLAFSLGLVKSRVVSWNRRRRARRAAAAAQAPAGDGGTDEEPALEPFPAPASEVR